MVTITVQNVVGLIMIVATEKGPKTMREPSWWTDPSYYNYGQKIEAHCTICGDVVLDWEDTDEEQCEDCRDGDD